MSTAVATRAESETATVMQVIERAASNPQVDIDKLERLLQMRERMEAQGAKAAYSAALSQMQPELPTITERGEIKNNSGNVMSRYALWEDVVAAITPILSKYGFAISFRTGNTDKGVTVTGVLSHSAGHSEETSLTLPIDTSGAKNAVQSVGSSTSYGKRYTAAALLNLRTGDVDDDGRRGGSAATISDEQVIQLTEMIDSYGIDKKAFLKYLKVESLDAIAATNFESVVKAIKARNARAGVRS